MARYNSEQMENEAARTVASLMATAARTAPKSGGVDRIKTLVVDGDELELLAAELEEAGKENRSKPRPWTNSATLVKKSKCVLLIGINGAEWERPLLNCGACGYKDCETMRRKVRRRQGNDFVGPTCLFRALDLGIALGSAVKLASELNADNRIFYTIGVAAKRLNVLVSDIVIGIPISIRGKNPYFDLDRQSMVSDGEGELGAK